jgi:hypothetical protein
VLLGGGVEGAQRCRREAYEFKVKERKGEIEIEIGNKNIRNNFNAGI